MSKTKKITLTETELVNFIEDVVKEKQGKKIKESKGDIVKIANRLEKVMAKNIVNESVLVNSILNEITKLDKAGYSNLIIEASFKEIDKRIKSKKQINEGLLDFFMGNSSLGQGLGSYLQEKVIGFILGMFGFDTSQGLGRYIKISLANVPFRQLPRLWECNFAAFYVTKGTFEWLVAEGLNKLFSGEQEGEMGAIIRNYIMEAGSSMNDSTPGTATGDGFVDNMIKSVSDFICVKLLKKKGSVESNIDKQYSTSEKVQNWFTDLLKTGEGSKHGDFGLESDE